ncbi:cytochrome b, partial [Escherichia coli]|nr:cytochrome b [Escherichia coli]
LDVVVFGGVTLPPLAPVSEAWEKGLFALHWGLTRLLIGLLVLHVAGALYRHFVKRDRSLRRIIGG